jgi:hypothetical protein
VITLKYRELGLNLLIFLAKNMLHSKNVLDTNPRFIFWITLLTMFLMSQIISSTLIASQHANAAASRSDKPGNAVNSIYLSISDHRYRSGQFSDTITGTIVNNSTQDISSAQVYAALYDKENKLITMESGSVSVSSLRAGDDSPFTINIFGSKDNVDHYTIFPAGTPS